MIANQEAFPYVSFEIRAEEDRNASIAAGHFVGKDVVYAQVTRPGSRDSLDIEALTWLKNIEKRASEGLCPGDWPRAIRAKYEAFLRDEALPESGTPIKGWPVLSPAVQKTLISAGFSTVEALAAAGEPELNNIGMGAMAYRTKARAWLEDAKTKGASVEKITDLTQKVADLTDLVQTLIAENTKLKEGQESDKKPLATLSQKA